ncbi:DUF2281 domain-containing protein [Nostoc sp. FACHB-892]|jgi:hypothetical protein|uniref:DUF2281 domain-containing protein n=1 Tax=unclassified Nostoc TaxID=2593658 RepID=UPI00168912C3|nr:MULTISPECIES: DUF2281 domain-containing protein [unclassified Nostoc]MBD2248147.1 DUF2281 domain-containing protein [Nostoc sp. FACHB-888]MBD2731057.1 DUF2281 domain-containing protein [Nostoc sp. FACHB-892]
MTIKELLLIEIESTSDTILTETLDFLRFLKTKETQTQPVSSVADSADHTPVNSTGRSLLEHLKTIGKWSGDDLQECLELVYATRGKAKFDYDNPFE